MKSYYCCDCGHLMEEKEIGVEFLRFTDDRKPVYKKVFAFYCINCEKFRQVSKEGRAER